MTLEQFRQSLEHDQPPGGLGFALGGLWWDAKGNWNQAHDSAQQDESPAGSWVHAYLHRKEGDLSNADYWYRRAQRPRAHVALEQEWLQIVESLLGLGEPG